MFFKTILLMALCPGVPVVESDRPAVPLVNPIVMHMHRESVAWRARYGLAAMTLDTGLCRLAQQHAEYMARTGRYEHGLHDQVIHRGPVTAQEAVSGWMGSGPHAAWLLGGNRRCGWGHAVGFDGLHYWVGVFR